MLFHLSFKRTYIPAIRAPSASLWRCAKRTHDRYIIYTHIFIPAPCYSLGYSSYFLFRSYQEEIIQKFRAQVATQNQLLGYYTSSLPASLCLVQTMSWLVVSVPSLIDLPAFSKLTTDASTSVEERVGSDPGLVNSPRSDELQVWDSLLRLS